MRGSEEFSVVVPTGSKLGLLKEIEPSNSDCVELASSDVSVDASPVGTAMQRGSSRRGS